MFVLASQAGLTIFNLWFNRQKLPENNEVAGLIFGVISQIYPLILASVIVAVWTNYDDLNETVEKRGRQVEQYNEIRDSRPRHQNAPSEGFFIDILFDDTGISLHRFQNFIWTLISLIVYLYKVSGLTEGCQLPELSDTLLALIWISSATYLVLRIQGKWSRSNRACSLIQPAIRSDLSCRQANINPEAPAAC